MIEGGHLPKVTVAMPVLNGGRFLRAAVLSIVQQTFTDWELLLIDDGSTDGSLETIQDIQDARIRVIKDGLNKGLAARLNEAIDLARGRYFARMDHDDISYPERFARQLAMLEDDRSLDLVGTRSIAISQDNQIVGFFPYALNHQQLCAKPWRGFYLAHPTWMGKIEWFRRHRYAAPGPYLSEDTELLLRSFSASRFGVVPEILFAYRVRNEIAWRKMLKTRWTVLKLQLHYFIRGNQFGFALLALLAFYVRVGMDLFNVALQVLGVPIFLRFRGTVDAATKFKWQAVLLETQTPP
jgi:glycosyltransferase involved in cell wall biosynthesis